MSRNSEGASVTLPTSHFTSQEDTVHARLVTPLPAPGTTTVAHVHTLVIIWRLLPLALSFARDFRRWIVFGVPALRDPSFHEQRAARLVATLVTLGPTFVKLAQVFGSRPDIIPDPYLTALGSLTDRVPPVPFEDIERELLASYGQHPDEIFEGLGREPLAAGSLGQVYRARYEDAEVVVKVLRPNVEALVAMDIRAVRRLLDVVSARWSNPHLNAFRVVVDEFSFRIAEEMDFQQEAAYATAIGESFAANPRVLIPTVVHALTRRRVIVMEYMRGTRVDSLAPLIAEGAIRGEQVVEAVVEAYIQMMLVDGLFHADPHPGNLLVTDDGRLVLLDFGMVVRVDPVLRQQLIRTALAAVSRDADGVIKGFFDLGIVVPDTDVTVIRRLVDVLLRMAFEGVASAEIANRMLTDRTLADDVMRTIYNWPIVLRGELVFFGRAVALIEGIGARYVPNFNPVNFAGPLILRHRGKFFAAMGSDAIAREHIAILIARLAGDIGRVLLDATRQIAGVVVSGLPALLAPFSQWVDPPKQLPAEPVTTALTKVAQTPPLSPSLPSEHLPVT